MNILNVSQRYFIDGGSDRYFFDLAELLTHNGHEVVPFCAALDGNYDTPYSEFFPKGIDFSHPSILDLLRYVYSTEARVSIERVLDEHVFDIAHLHIYYGQLTSSILKPLKKKGVKIVQTLHEYKTVCPVYSLISNGHYCEKCKGGKFYKAIFNRCNRGKLSRSCLSAFEAYFTKINGGVTDIDLFIAVSEFQRKKLISLGIPTNKIVVLNNYTNLPSRVLPRGQKWILYFGRIQKEKGLKTLIDAYQGVKGLPLLIVGEGEYKKELSEYIVDNNIETVHLLGAKSGKELDSLIYNSLFTVLPSECNETFGLTIIESFARNIPVLGSDSGAIPELISDGYDGLVFSTGSVSHLQQQIEWFLNNKKSALEMGDRGRIKVENKYSPQSHYEKLMAIYERLFKE